MAESRYTYLGLVRLDLSIPEDVQLFKCNDCGAVVTEDQSIHDFFHDEVNEATGEVYEFNEDRERRIPD